MEGSRSKWMKDPPSSVYGNNEDAGAGTRAEVDAFDEEAVGSTNLRQGKGVGVHNGKKKVKDKRVCTPLALHLHTPPWCP
jgi:hypothetical protein